MNIYTIENNFTVYAGTSAYLLASGLNDAQVLQAAKDWAKRQLANNRYNTEKSGTLWNNFPVATDRESQSKSTAAYIMAKDSLWIDGKVWKFADGVSRAMTTQNILDMAVSVSSHVQACYEAEAAKVASIDACTTLAEVESLDLTVSI